MVQKHSAVKHTIESTKRLTQALGFSERTFNELNGLNGIFTVQHHNHNTLLKYVNLLIDGAYYNNKN